MCWGEEPVDFVMAILKVLSKLGPESLRFTMYGMKMFVSLVLDFAFGILIYMELIKVHFSDEVEDSMWPYIGYAAFYCIALSVLIYQYYRVAREMMHMRILFLTYKAIDLLLGLLNAAGFIYGRDDIDFKDWKQVIAIALTGCDVVFNPIQILIACCCARDDQ